MGEVCGVVSVSPGRSSLSGGTGALASGRAMCDQFLPARFSAAVSSRLWIIPNPLCLLPDQAKACLPQRSPLVWRHCRRGYRRLVRGCPLGWIEATALLLLHLRRRHHPGPTSGGRPDREGILRPLFLVEFVSSAPAQPDEQRCADSRPDVSKEHLRVRDTFDDFQ